MAGLADIQRRLENLVAFGVITRVDHEGRRVRATISGRETGWLPYPADIGANFIRWKPLRAGTQVVLACPSGNPANAVIVQVLYSDALPPPDTSDGLDVIQWNDGTTVSYDSLKQHLFLRTPGSVGVEAGGDVRASAGQSVDISAATTARIAAQTVEIVASGGGSGAASMTGSFSLNGDLAVTGVVTVNGSLHASGDILAGGANSNHHSHT